MPEAYLCAGDVEGGGDVSVALSLMPYALCLIPSDGYLCAGDVEGGDDVPLSLSLHD